MEHRGITKMELLLAVAMSEYFEKSHVLFVPPCTEYTNMLNTLKNSGDITTKGLNSYVVTPKGHRYIQNNYKVDVSHVDREIDKFLTGIN